MNQNAAMGRELSTANQGKANSLYSTLAPTLTAEATNPQGFGAPTVARMNTAAQQSIGGSTAGIVGQGALQAARSRNAGALAPALSEAGREGMRQNSSAALDIENKDALLKEANRQSGIKGLSDLYGGLDESSLKALGISTDSYSKAAQAYQNPWAQILGQGLGAGATAYAGR